MGSRQQPPSFLPEPLFKGMGQRPLQTTTASHKCRHRQLADTVREHIGRPAKPCGRKVQVVWLQWKIGISAQIQRRGNQQHIDCPGL